MAENYFYSSLTGEQIENRLLGAVLFNGSQTLTTSQKEQARANIGAGSENTGFRILGYFDTLQDLEEWLQVLPSPGDAYGIGTEDPYTIYVWDGVTSTWIDNGTISTTLLIDDNDISTSSTWSSQKINGEISGFGNKQDEITANGILRGLGSGSVTAAVKGTDYAALSFTVTLLPNNWVNSTQTISNENFALSGYSYIVSPTGTWFNQYGSCGIYADDVSTAGQMTFHCSNNPTDDLVVNIVRVVTA